MKSVLRSPLGLEELEARPLGRQLPGAGWRAGGPREQLSAGSAGESVAGVNSEGRLQHSFIRAPAASTRPNRRCKSQLVFAMMEATISPSHKQCLGKKARVPRLKC